MQLDLARVVRMVSTSKVVGSEKLGELAYRAVQMNTMFADRRRAGARQALQTAAAVLEATGVPEVRGVEILALTLLHSTPLPSLGCRRNLSTESRRRC